MTQEDSCTPTELRNSVPQKPVSQAMMSEPHGIHNYAEYREVIDATKNRQENVFFWARYGLNRLLGRVCRQLNASLRFNCSSIADDEYDKWLCFLRVVAPMQRELEQCLPSTEDFAIRVQDYSSLNRLLSKEQASGDNVLYWARYGVFEGLESWRLMSNMVISNKIPPIELRGVTHEPEAFLRHADLLIAAHQTA